MAADKRDLESGNLSQKYSETPSKPDRPAFRSCCGRLSPKSRSDRCETVRPHVVENGALAIERRWIDVELPDYEVLDALARVYSQLALMTISLHEHCCVLIPEKSSGLGEHLLRDLMPDDRLPSMSRPFDDRGIYIAVKDGSFLGHRREFRTTDTEKARKVVKR